MNQRTVAILHQIIKAHSYISVEELSTLFNLSRRTIYNDLDQINDWLDEHYQSQLNQVRGKGLYLGSALKKEISTNTDISHVFYYNFSKEERKAWIYIYLVGQNKNYYLRDFQELFQVSRSTVINDIKALKKAIASHDVSLFSDPYRGYHIHGDEMVIRKLLTQYLGGVVSADSWFHYLKGLEGISQQNMGSLQPYAILDIKDIEQIRWFLNQYEQQVAIELTDDVRNNLMIWFYFFMRRIGQKYYAEIEPAEKEVIRMTEEFTGARKLCNELADYFKVHIPMSEVDYFTRYFLGAKVNYDLNFQLESQELKQLTTVVKKMVRDFQMYAAVEFPDQEQMIRNLLLHLKPTYYRKKYGIQIQNVLKDSVKKKYPEIFHLTKKVIHHVEELLGQDVGDDEIAYIAMHFGGWLRQEGVVLGAKRKRMLIICTTGLGTAYFLKSQLEGLFSDVDTIGVFSVQEYEDTPELSGLTDFIISTIALPDKGIPVFVIEPILSNEDKVKLLKQVSQLFGNDSNQHFLSINTVMDIIGKHAEVDDEQSLETELKSYLFPSATISHESESLSLMELLPASRIMVKENVTNWEEAITEASRPLLEQHLISKQYIQQMIQIVKDYGPYIVISDHVALPHASPDAGVHQTGMSMLLLNDEVDLLGKPVHLIIVVASVDNEQHLKALSQLTQLFSNKALKAEIMGSTDSSDLVNTFATTIAKLSD